LCELNELIVRKPRCNRIKKKARQGYVDEFRDIRPALLIKGSFVSKVITDTCDSGDNSNSAQ